MKKVRRVRALIKEPGQDFKTEYVDLSYQTFEELFKTVPSEVFQMQVLACRNAIVIFSYSSEVENCKVFDTVFNGTIMFVGEKTRGGYCDLNDKDDDLIRRFTRTPEDYRIKRLRSGGTYLWEI